MCLAPPTSPGKRSGRCCASWSGRCTINLSAISNMESGACHNGRFAPFAMVLFGSSCHPMAHFLCPQEARRMPAASEEVIDCTALHMQHSFGGGGFLQVGVECMATHPLQTTCLRLLWCRLHTSSNMHACRCRCSLTPCRNHPSSQPAAGLCCWLLAAFWRTRG